MDTVGLPLKVFVVAAGALLLVGSIVLAILVALGIGAERAERPERGERGPLAAIGEPLPLPPGARVEQVVPDPSGGPLILLGTDRNGAPFLALIDLERGTLVRLIRLEPGAMP